MKITVKQALIELAAALNEYKGCNHTLSVDSFSLLQYRVEKCSTIIQDWEEKALPKVELLEKEVEIDPSMLMMIAINLRLMTAVNERIDAEKLARSAIGIILAKIIE